MSEQNDGIPRPALMAAGGLALLLVAAVVTISAYNNTPDPAAPKPDNAPLAVVPVPAPQANSADCARLTGALPDSLLSGGQQLRRLTLATPTPPATVAWGSSDEPVVFRCGLPAPSELGSSSQLTYVGGTSAKPGVSWLKLSDRNQSTYYAVDRPVYVALTLPDSSGSGPLQRVSAEIATTLSQTPVIPKHGG